MFDPVRWHRILLEVLVNPEKRNGPKIRRSEGNVQEVFPERAVQIRRMCIETNYPPEANDDRLFEWIPALEARHPTGWHDKGQQYIGTKMVTLARTYTSGLI